MKFFVTGDSHVAALKRGHALLHSRNQLVPGHEFHFHPFGNAGLLRQPFFEREPGRVVVTEPSYRKRVPVLPADGFEPGGSVIAISGYFHFSGIWTAGLWRQGWLAEGPEGRGRGYSRGMLGAIALHRMRYLLELGEALAEIGCRVCAIEGPGPFSHDPALERVPIARIDAIRRTCRDAVAEALSAIGIPVVEVPAQHRRSDGILDDALRNEDPTDTYHAGSEFGAIMIGRLQARYG